MATTSQSGQEISEDIIVKIKQRLFDALTEDQKTNLALTIIDNEISVEKVVFDYAVNIELKGGVLWRNGATKADMSSFIERAHKDN